MHAVRSGNVAILETVLARIGKFKVWIRSRKNYAVSVSCVMGATADTSRRAGEQVTATTPAIESLRDTTKRGTCLKEFSLAMAAMRPPRWQDKLVSIQKQTLIASMIPPPDPIMNHV